MDQFTTAVVVSRTNEALDGTGVIEFTVTIESTTGDVSGTMSITTTDVATNMFFVTGAVYDVVITPHVEVP